MTIKKNPIVLLYLWCIETKVLFSAKFKIHFYCLGISGTLVFQWYWIHSKTRDLVPTINHCHVETKSLLHQSCHGSSCQMLLQFLWLSSQMHLKTKCWLSLVDRVLHSNQQSTFGKSNENKEVQNIV